MFLRYLVAVYRVMMQEKIYTSINVVGLALGISCFVILSLYVSHELAYDEHFANHESIYRVSSFFAQRNGNEVNYALSAEGFGPLIVADYPQFDAFVRFRRSSENVLAYQDVIFSWDDIYLVDENVFEVFDHEIVAGDPTTALQDIDSIAISESLARSYFGEEDPIGKFLEGNSSSHRVSLVFADLPDNTHLKYSALYPYGALSRFVPDYEDSYIRGLTIVRVFTYLQANTNFDPASFDEINKSFVEKYMTGGLARIDSIFQARLTPLNEVHFDNSISSDLPNGNLFYLYGLSALGIAILMVACINYTNLATARVTRRLKEIGVRKVLGANRSQLVQQFLGESLFLVLLSLFLASVLIYTTLLLNPLDSSAFKEMFLSGVSEPVIYLYLPIIVVIVTLLSGIYPAIALASVSPKALFLRNYTPWRGGLLVRKFLVVVQMTTSIIVSAITLLMFNQLDFVASKPLGFDKDHQVWIELRGADVIENVDTLRNELIAQPGVASVLDTSMVPGFGNASNIVYAEDNVGVFGAQIVDRVVVGLDYISSFGIDIIEGRSFSREFETDRSSALLVNEALVRKLGWDDALGKQISTGSTPATVIGVTADFHYAPLNNLVGPLLIQPLDVDFENISEASRPLQRRSIVVKITQSNIENTLATIEDTIRKFDPDHLFNPSFLDVRLEELYRSDAILLSAVTIFTAISISLSMMGIFGLTLFSISQRKKEIAIRKVMGASGFRIVALMCRGFLPIALFSIVPGVVVSFFVFSSWLDSYAYTSEASAIQLTLPYIALHCG